MALLLEGLSALFCGAKDAHRPWAEIKNYPSRFTCNFWRLNAFLPVDFAVLRRMSVKQSGQENIFGTI